MKRKLFALLLIIGGQISLFAQRNPFNEILVYFNTGVKQEIKIIKGQPEKFAAVYMSNLKESLNQIGIDESMIEIAMPSFNQADTLKVLSNGIKLYQPDMTKLFRITIPSNEIRSVAIKI
ncbi:MAG: hypothetical protein MUO72_03705 [Bacteroidales bacterium]|nr:hypothetical protein [Bacteroidales bacterium]